MNGKSAGTLVAVAAVVLGLAVAGGPLTEASAATAAGGTWGVARQLTIVPGTTPVAVPAVSCTAPGECSAIGSYSTDGSVDDNGAYGATETVGVWGHPEEIPGLAAITHHVGDLTISCATPGNCAAAGFYYPTGKASHGLPFVVSQVQGAWGVVHPVDTSNLTGVTGGWLSTISCGSPGNCSAGGTALLAAGQNEALVVTEVNGVWGPAQAIPSPTGSATIDSISCAADGGCAATGVYQVNTRGGQLAFVVDGQDGTWGAAQPIPSLAALTSDSFAWTAGVSCTALGECTVVGAYGAGVGILPFAASEVNGHWGNASQLPGAGSVYATDSGVSKMLLSCPAAGNCMVAVDYSPSELNNSPIQAFAVAQANGTWQQPDPISPPAGTGANVAVYVNALSCASAGDCGLSGYYVPESAQVLVPRVLVASAVNGAWGSAQHIAVPLSSANLGGIWTAISCGAPGYCSAAIFDSGVFGGAFLQRLFMVNEGAASATSMRVSTLKAAYGDEQAASFAATVTSTAGGTPSGTVTVTAGGTPVCTIRLSGGTGSCAPAKTALQGGTYQLTGTYSGDGTYVSSVSTAQAFTVAQARTSLAFSMASATITYGHETAERLTVIVAGQYRTIPTGKVTVNVGRVTLCTITLRAARGSCTLSATRLRAGTYQLTAHYAGSADFTPSTATKTLKVVA